MTSVLDTKLAVNTDAPAYALDSRRIAASMWEPTHEFNITHWVSAVEASTLPRKLKGTARAIASDATSRGYSTIDNQTLASLAGVSRLNTITDRLKQLRNAGFLESTPRFNNSSSHRLTNPVGINPNELDRTVSDWPDTGQGF